MTVLLDQPSAAQTVGGVSSPLLTEALTTLEVNVDVTVVSGTSTPTLTLFVEGQAADGNWYPLWSPSGITSIGETSTSIGPGCATQAVLTGLVRLRWAITGTTPSFTFSASIEGR